VYLSPGSVASRLAGWLVAWLAGGLVVVMAPPLVTSLTIRLYGCQGGVTSISVARRVPGGGKSDPGVAKIPV
jgi:hypothetical protein